MPFHETSTPPQKVFVRREFMMNHESGHGEYEAGILISVRSIPGSCALFQVLLENGALRDKLPIHALHHERHEHVHPFHHLQLWNCFSANFALVELQFLSGLRVDVRMKNGEWAGGRYLWTMQWGSDVSHGIDYSLAVDPEEHKSGHLIELDCGEYAIQPNNRLRWYEPSHVTKPWPAKPEYKVNTDAWNCEAHEKWTTEDSDAWAYDVAEVVEEDRRQVPCSEADAGQWRVDLPSGETEIVNVEWDFRGFCVIPAAHLGPGRQLPVYAHPDAARWTRLTPGFPMNTQVSSAAGDGL